jgi:hypothetical protein
MQQKRIIKIKNYYYYYNNNYGVMIFSEYINKCAYEMILQV